MSLIMNHILIYSYIEMIWVMSYSAPLDGSDRGMD